MWTAVGAALSLRAAGKLVAGSVDVTLLKFFLQLLLGLAGHSCCCM